MRKTELKISTVPSIEDPPGAKGLADDWISQEKAAHIEKDQTKQTKQTRQT